MTPADLYRRLTIPTRFRVFGFRLVPFTVGHARLIDRLEVSEIRDGATALWVAKVCSMPAADAEKWVNSRWLELSLWWLTQTRKRLLKSQVEVEKAIKVLGEYLDESTKVPTYTAKGEGVDGEKLGCPFSQHLRATLLSRLNYSPSELDATPFLVALWDYIAFMELDGHITINDEPDDATEEALLKQAEELMKRVQAGEVPGGS